MQTYLTDISKVALLTREQEVALGRAVQRGCKCRPAGPACPACAAKDHLVQANLRLVVNMADRYYKRKGVSLDDLVGEGNLGLIRAAELYSPDEFPNIRFSTYACWWIRQAMQRALEHYRQGAARVPPNSYRLIPALADARNAMCDALGRPPTAEELAARLGVRPGQIALAEAGERASTAISLNQTAFGHNERDEIKDLLAARADPLPEDADTEPADRLRKAIRRLPKRDRDIVTRRWGLNGRPAETLMQIAADYGLSKERIRQVEKRCLKKLRSMLLV